MSFKAQIAGHYRKSFLVSRKKYRGVRTPPSPLPSGQGESYRYIMIRTLSIAVAQTMSWGRWSSHVESKSRSARARNSSHSLHNTSTTGTRGKGRRRREASPRPASSPPSARPRSRNPRHYCHTSGQAYPGAGHGNRWRRSDRPSGPTAGSVCRRGRSLLRRRDTRGSRAPKNTATCPAEPKRRGSPPLFHAGRADEDLLAETAQKIGISAGGGPGVGVSAHLFGGQLFECCPCAFDSACHSKSLLGRLRKVRKPLTPWWMRGIPANSTPLHASRISY